MTLRAKTFVSRADLVEFYIKFGKDAFSSVGTYAGYGPKPKKVKPSKTRPNLELPSLTTTKTSPGTVAPPLNKK
jgi:hypothetical protein